MSSPPPLFNCSVCGRPFSGLGNNADPINPGRCCDLCNMMYVIPARIRLLREGEDGQEEQA